MPSNTNTDKEIDNLEQATEADKKFIAFKKRMFWLGIGFLIAAIVLSLPNYFFLETANNILGVGIFLFVVLADIFILLPAIITKETNWPALLGSTILCIVFLCLSVFYPFQDFQYRLKVISLVATIATLLFVALNSWINAAFFPSKNANIRHSVDFASNRFAVDVLNVTLILGTLFGTIAFLYFNPDKDNSTFFGGIDIKNVALATAGLVTFFWAAKATKNKSIELEEKKQDGKRHDNEIAMAKRRDTAQLIAEASKLLSSENDSQKYAGLSFLNRVASDPKGPLRKEAFDLIADFILTASDITTENKVRLRAILYADNLVGNNPYNFGINEFIIISRSYRYKRDEEINNLNTFEIKNLYISYIGLTLYSEFIQRSVKTKFKYHFGFLHCFFYGKNYEDGKMQIINSISAINCNFRFCKIEELKQSNNIENKNRINGRSEIMQIFPKKYFIEKDEENPQLMDRDNSNDLDDIYNNFDGCDFSNCLTWIDICVPTKEKHRSGVFSDCFYYSGYKPNDFNEEYDRKLLKEITSKEQFDELFYGDGLAYSPPADKK